MVQVVSYDAACDHLRVEPGDDFEDIAGLIAAAQGRVEDFLDRPLVTAATGDGGWANAAAVPPAVVHAVKLVLGDLYLNREAPQLTDDQLRPICGRFMRLSVG